MSPVKSVERALAVLRCFDHQALRLTIPEIAARVQMPRSSVYRFLRTLVDHRFVTELDDTDRRVYALGPAILELGRIGLGEPELRRCAYPVMRIVAEKTGESAYLSVRQGTQAVCIENIDAATPLRYGGRVGYVYPLYAGSPKIILAFLEPSLRDHIIKGLEFEPLTSRTIKNREQLLRRLARIRRRGYEVSHGEIFLETKAVGAPILDDSGSACAVLSIGAPQSRITRSNETTIGRIVMEGAQDITTRFHRKSSGES